MLGAVFGSGGGFSLPGYLASSPHLILSGRSSESRGPIASPGGLGGTLSRIYGSMMGVQSETYESCCRPCSPIIWGDMPQTHRDKPIAEKRRELRLPSRPLAMLRWSLWKTKFVASHLDIPGQQRCGHSVAFQHLTPRFRDMRRVSHGDRPSRQGASTDMQSSHPCRCVISRRAPGICWSSMAIRCLCEHADSTPSSSFQILKLIRLFTVQLVLPSTSFCVIILQ